MSARLERLKARLKELPERPGVYLHKNAEGQVIYVGKARNLRNRVTSYLVGRGARDAKTMTLINEIDAIDFVTTNNELEAILLENNLIKAHQPRYNILLRDDKSYPYLKVTLSEDYPRVVFTRRVDRKKGDLFFGPFFAGTARRILKLVADQFKLRSCDLDIDEGKSALSRPCLYYDMHQCLGPCVVGLTTSAEYREMVDDVVLFLSGKSKELQARLGERMYRAAEQENYEIATYYRDLIRTVERIQAEQQVESAEDEDMDVWGLYEEGNDVAVQLFVIRGGSVVDRRELFWEKIEEYQPGYFLSEILQRYYQDNLFIPNEILMPFEVEDRDLLLEWLASQAQRKVNLRVPQRGRGVDRLELANRNARLSHESRFKKSQQDRLAIAAERLGTILGYGDRAIQKIESFDISNIQGTDSVAGMVVLDRGKFDKNQYRVFNIKTVIGADDFRSMAEAVDRRYRRLLEESKALPDMILIDGGRGQLNAALAALNKLGVEEIPIAGLAKREEEIYVPDREEPIRLDRHDPALQLLQMVRDETHRFAVSSHRRRRAKRTLHSALDDLPGIGEKRKRLLLERFGSVSAIKQASAQDLMHVLGRKVGQTLWDELHE
ncbi:MAG: excinuclease ABC subunit UvrC [Acidobacteria bacterium]|nr:excinuclease ABC subunit UvrC [Acidobacteriota bacterium]MBV9474538.1 excinuclease ABC subunit UvrC [Acidobacteriota bacterium]